MLPEFADAGREDFHRFMGRSIRAVVRDAARIEDPAELEQLGFELCEPLAVAPDLAVELMGMIAEQRTSRADVPAYPRGRAFSVS